MESTGKLNKLLTTGRDKNETEDWIFSLTPVGVAFVFYVFFIMMFIFISLVSEALIYFNYNFSFSSA